MLCCRVARDVAIASSWRITVACIFVGVINHHAKMHIAKLCHFWAHAVEIRRKNHMSHGQFNLNLQETSNHHLHAADSQTLHSSWRFWNFLKFWSSQTEYWSSNFRSYKLCACCVVIIASTSSHMISRSHFEACTHTHNCKSKIKNLWYHPNLWSVCNLSMIAEYFLLPTFMSSNHPFHLNQQKSSIQTSFIF